MTAQLLKDPPPIPSLDRDLSFRPIPEDAPRERLTLEQVRAFNRDGFLPRLPLFDGPQIASNAASFDHLLKLYLERGMNSYQINSCQSTCGSIFDLAVHPLVTSMVADLLGPAFACWSTHYFCKLPYDEAQVSWHQDAPYWPFNKAGSVTVWLAIDDIDPGNGAMQVIPGTHRLGALPLRYTTPEEKNVLWIAVDEVERWGKPVPMVLRAGEASVHADMLLHGSPPNPSPRRRCALALRYCTLDTPAGEGWNSRSILIRGSDPSGHWGGVQRRPSGENPFEEAAIGAN